MEQDILGFKQTEYLDGGAKALLPIKAQMGP